MSFLRDKLFNLVISIIQLTPYPVTHNIEKARALRKAFWHINLERLEGDYFEFGVAFGNSLEAARLASRRSTARRLGVKSQARRFYAFDTFESFVSDDLDDDHATWRGVSFSFPYDSVVRRFKRHPEVKIFKGDATQLGSEGDFKASVAASMGDESKVAIVMFDMDLKGPTAGALRFIEPRLQTGSLMFFDEFFAFNGNPQMGESGALSEFLAQNPRISLREFAHYGDGGRVFQVQVRED